MQIQRSIGTTAELYGKLERGFDRRATYGDYQVDWVFDVAVTAWHLVDWVATEAGISIPRAQEELKCKSSELAVCEQVCNGAKHLVLSNPSLVPFDVATNVHASGAQRGILRNAVPGADEPLDIRLTPEIMITDRDGTSWEAIGLLHRVLTFWKSELGV